MNIIIQLRPVCEGNYSWYECFNITDNHAIPIAGVNIPVIKMRVQQLYPFDTVSFEIGE